MWPNLAKSSVATSQIWKKKKEKELGQGVEISHAQFNFLGGLFKEEGVLKLAVWIHSKHFMLVCVLEINNSRMLKITKKN